MKTSLLRFLVLSGVVLLSDTALAQGRPSPCNLNNISDITVKAEKGKSGATVNLPDPNQNNGCGKITYTPASGTTFPIGATKVLARSANGSVSKEFTVTVVDADPPVITCPEGIVTVTDAGSCAAVLSNLEAPAATDNSDVSVTGTRNDNQSLDAPYPKGTTIITWTARDAGGNEASCTQQVVVSDKEAPAITPPFTDEAISENTDAGVCTYTVKGTEFDASVTDNCAGPITISYAWVGATEGSVSNSLAGVVFNKGTTSVLCSATDAAGNAAEWWFSVTVNDNQRPVINSVKATPDVLWSPNHKMVDVTLTYDVTENCPGLTYQIVSITSNEPLNGQGDGNTELDWNEGTDGLHIQLRSERSGKGSDRIYTIIVKVMDASGNVSDEVPVTVTVPHDQGKKEGAENDKTLDVTVGPNPSSHSFTFKANSQNTKDKITMVVSDNLGRPLYRKTDISSGQSITMGSDLQPGTYYVEFIQGAIISQHRVIKVQ